MNGIESPSISLPPSVTDILKSSPHEFLQPSCDLHSAILALSKFYLDPVASHVSLVQQQRLQEARHSKKRKRRNNEGEEQVLRLKSIAVEGFDAQQIWEQTKRVAAAVDVEVLRAVEAQKKDTVLNGDHDGESKSENSEEDDDSDDSIINDKDSDIDEIEDEADKEEFESFGDDDSIDLNAAIDEGEGSDDSSTQERTYETLKLDKFGLNDGFFSIEDFNRRTEMLEQQDFRGDPDADAASDEEDVEWDIDPASAESQAQEKTRKKTRDPESLDLDDLDAKESEEDDDEEAGPTFGDMDLNAPEGASDDDDEADIMQLDDIDGQNNPDNFMYQDFFEPPARKQSQITGKQRKQKSQNHLGSANAEPIDEEQALLRTMAAVRRDLYSDESEGEDEMLDVKQDTSKMSTHEKRKAAILTQIRELEANNVAKRPWVLAGEARAQDRPVNALLEEDLDFERTGKPLPVITAETSEEIEQLIKRRVLAGEFDEVRKRRADEALADSARRGRLAEVNLDNPDRKGLADMYEEEHLRKTDVAYVDQRTQKLKKEHGEIEAVWKDITGKLDSLASFRYRPKPAEISIAVRSDAPAMSLEDARPSGIGGDIGTLSQLAPQEVYAPGEVKEHGKIATRGGQVIDQAELSREERTRRRRRDKERAKKAANQKETLAPKKQTGQEKKVTMAGDLRRGGVKLIGKKGEVRDIEGNEVREGVKAGAGNFKL